LDYHKTFEEYIRVKKSYFDQLPTHAFAITNSDDKHGSVMLQNSVAKKLTYSLKTTADFKGKIIDNSITGLQYANQRAGSNVQVDRRIQCIQSVGCLWLLQ